MGLFNASCIMCCGPSIFASMAFILGLYANSRCSLVSLLDEDSTLRLIRPEPELFGLGCYESTNGGSSYDLRDIDFGSKIEAARAMGLVSVTIMALYRRYQHRGPSWNEITTMTESFPNHHHTTRYMFVLMSHRVHLGHLADLSRGIRKCNYIFISLQKPPRSSQGSIKIQDTHPRRDVTKVIF